ncbi:MAG: CDP-alcohol phosphatidyltransferase family protein [Chitinophagaceae bacterium]|nr:CDP-alcohol phosphatidyltransferase family protein [Chitinophagaceae bacterium]
MPQPPFVKHIPNMFTLGNLFLGCLGILFAFNDHIFPVELKELDPSGKNLGIIFGYNNRLYLSSFMIFGAAALDFFDGFFARLLNANSPIGGQLDSLADGVTFGVLPACIYYQLLAGAWHLQPGALNIPMIYMLPAFLIALCSVYRLAKFNVDERQQSGFIGLATPASALFAAALPLIVFTNAFTLAPFILNRWFLYVAIALFSWLMVAEIPMFALKAKSFKWKGNEVQFIFLAISALLIIVFKYAGIAAVILLYILICLAQYFFAKRKDQNIKAETKSI